MESNQRTIEVETHKPSLDRKTLVIKPKSTWQVVDFRELWEYRDLFYFLVNRDIKVRYKQTVLGGLWAIIQPLFMMVIFSLFFGRLAKIPSDGIPYPIFSYAAMVPWVYFAGAITNSGNSLIQEVNLISKVYFPRLIIPITPILAGLLDFSIASMVLIGMMLWYGIYPTVMTVLFPPLVLLMMLSVSGVGMVLAALNAKYRDIRYTIPFIVQFWMFASPIVYPSSMIPERYRIWYGLNPMAGIIEGFRSILLGSIPFPTEMVMISVVVSIIFFMAGMFYFRQMERFFADII